MEYIWVGLGSALGGMARHGIAVLALQRFGPAFPWGTLIVNVLGSFAIGLIATLSAQGKAPFALVSTQRFLIVGVLGGFTTFSSFSLQTLELFEKGQTVSASMNVVTSLVACLLSVWLGTRTGRMLLAG